ncbi:MAG: hypothetical protein R3A45_00535 [Bdellovibrionota bacterium]|nr:hypothetical protein [Deltaproteobacteria bacterium]
MNNITKMGKIFGVVVLSLNLIFCGDIKEGTGGGSYTVVKANQEITLYIPTATASIQADDVTLSIAVTDNAHLSHFEIERKFGTSSNTSFVYLADNNSGTFDDSNLANGTYAYRVVAVYDVQGQEEVSEAVIVSGLNVNAGTMTTDDGSGSGSETL